MSTFKILVADEIAKIGIEALRAEPSLEVDVKFGLSEKDLVAIASEYSAIIVRSATKITKPVLEAATQLKAVGRAGVGVDNIDIPAASRAGVVVMNTPTGNTISTAEHAFSLMMSLARNVPQGHASIKAGRWDRKLYTGVELNKKVLAVLGMGRIGSEFATRAQAFGMDVVAYDPYLSESRAKQLGVRIAATVIEAIKEADFVTLHMPKTPETTHMIGEESLKAVKPGVRIINCARGGLIDEAALLKALEDGRVGGAALDVYEVEPPPADFPLREREDVIFTPHLGASTLEAEENCGIEIADTIRNFLLKSTVVNAINMPSVDAETVATIEPFLKFGEKLGVILSQLGPDHADALEVRYSGNVADLDTALISRSILKGYFLRALGDEINTINAPGVAEGRGLKFCESRKEGVGEFADLLEVKVTKGKGKVVIAGTFFGGNPRIVKILGQVVDVDASATHLLLFENHDTPGVVGRVGTVLGKHNVNIASMSLGRNQAGGLALTAMTLDSGLDVAALEELRRLEGIETARGIEL